jgi:hypothetical protein
LLLLLSDALFTKAPKSAQKRMDLLMPVFKYAYANLLANMIRARAAPCHIVSGMRHSVWSSGAPRRPIFHAINAKDFIFIALITSASEGTTFAVVGSA